MGELSCQPWKHPIGTETLALFAVEFLVIETEWQNSA